MGASGAGCLSNTLVLHFRVRLLVVVDMYRLSDCKATGRAGDLEMHCGFEVRDR